MRTGYPFASKRFNGYGKVLAKSILLLLFVAGTLAGSAPVIDEVIVIKEPFVLRTLKGVIKSEAGEWPPEVPLHWLNFRLFGPDKSGKVWKIKLDERGRFSQKLPEGTYRFSIEIEGCDDAEGTIIIDKKADKKKVFELTLCLS